MPIHTSQRSFVSPDGKQCVSKYTFLLEGSSTEYHLTIYSAQLHPWSCKPTSMVEMKADDRVIYQAVVKDKAEEDILREGESFAQNYQG